MKILTRRQWLVISSTALGLLLVLWKGKGCAKKACDWYDEYKSITSLFDEEQDQTNT